MSCINKGLTEDDPVNGVTSLKPDGEKKHQNGVKNTVPADDGKMLDISNSCKKSQEAGEDKYDNPEREQWSSHCDFFLSCVGYAVGLGNIWRFPYLVYKNGGGSFLVPYVTMLFLIGIPLFFLELSIGQYASLGSAKVFSLMCPAGGGVGWGTIIVAFLIIIYYNQIVAWTLYYLYAGLTSKLPWTLCDSSSSKGCFTSSQNLDCLRSTSNQSVYYNFTCTSLLEICGTFDADVHNATFCSTKSNASLIKLSTLLNLKSASEEYFTNHVLGLKEENTWQNMGILQPHLVICLVLAWILVALCLIKGVKSSGKVVYVTALYPYVILIVFFVLGLTLEGSIDGIKWYITPQWETILTFKPWMDAATQIFYSLGVCMGALVTFSSYNRFKNNCLRDALLVSLINCSTSIFSGFVIFSIVGFMAHELQLPVGEVIKSGPGLTFIVYPEALSILPVSPLWSFLFFSMIMALGLDSQFGMAEAVISGIMDQFPGSRKYGKTVVVSVCATACLCGLPLCMNGGIFYFELLNWYSANWNTLFLALIECLMVGWVLGTNNFFNNLSEMGVNMSVTKWYFVLTLKLVSPLILVGLISINIYNFAPCKYENYTYPDFIQYLGLGISALPLAPVLLFLCSAIIRKEGGAFSTENWKPAEKMQ